MDATGLLLDTLLGGLPEDTQKEIKDNTQLKKESLKFLEKLLNESDAETLLASSIRPSQETSSTAKTMIEQMAELDSEQRLLDDSVREETYENVDLILDANQVYKECWELFANGMNESCEYMVADNVGKEEGDVQEGETTNWKTLIQLHERQSQRIRKRQQDGEAAPPASILLRDMDSIMDILELPTLANACVKSGHYGECVEIASHIRRISIRYSDVPLIQQVDTEIQKEIKGMINGLVRLLNTDLKQAHIIKIITYLKRIGPFQKGEGSGEMSNEILQRLFLKSRYQFILGELETLSPLKRSTEKYLKRCIEVIREHCFQTIATFESAFTSDRDRRVSLLLYSFIKSLILELCKVFNDNLPKLEESTRYGLFLQMIYCSQSLGRVGGDFTPIVLQQLQSTLDRDSWCDILRKQKQLIKSMNKSIGDGITT